MQEVILDQTLHLFIDTSIKILYRDDSMLN